MAPRKLSDSDKRDIIELYQQPNETTSTIAEQYDVSNSTISRILKSTLPEAEYSALIAQKRLAGADRSDSQTTQSKARAKPQRTRSRPSPQSEPQSEETGSASPPPEPTASPEPESTPEPEPVADTAKKPTAAPKLKSAADRTAVVEGATQGTRRATRNRSRADDNSTQLSLPETDEDSSSAAQEKQPQAPILKKDRKPAPAAEDAEDLEPVIDYSDLDDDLDDDDLDDDLDDNDFDSGEDDDRTKPRQPRDGLVQIMPLARAAMPKPCYLVIDRLSELITRPLSDFSELGQIPSDEETSQTLPVFDNHRVARRFSHRNQRVIKVPDGSLLTKTSPYLQAKGITRLLIDGQVYALM